MKEFYVYITTNPKKSVLYTGMTNNLGARLIEHYRNRGNTKTFAGRYFAYCLLHFECFATPLHAISREKEIKDWNRAKKEELISRDNPNWEFINNKIIEWPPHPDVTGRF